MGKIRAEVTRRMGLLPNVYGVKGTGLGGDIYCMLGAEMPFKLSNCRLVNSEVLTGANEEGLKHIGTADCIQASMEAGNLGAAAPPFA